MGRHVNGVPIDSREWTVADWIDLHECMNEARRRIGRRHHPELFPKDAMTGHPIRVDLDEGGVGIRDITECTDAELQRFVESRREDDRGWQWVVALARWIRDNVVKESPNAPDPESVPALPQV